jgi:DNA methyltransferase 1-associated protein 1
MEQIERRYRADRDDLMRTVMGLDSGLINLDQANSEGVLGGDKNRKRKKGELDEPMQVTASPMPTTVAPSKKKQEQAAAWGKVYA